MNEEFSGNEESENEEKSENEESVKFEINLQEEVKVESGNEPNHNSKPKKKMKRKIKHGSMAKNKKKNNEVKPVANRESFEQFLEREEKYLEKKSKYYTEKHQEEEEKSLKELKSKPTINEHSKQLAANMGAPLERVLGIKSNKKDSDELNPKSHSGIFVIY